MQVVVLGMHRGGTSVTAGILQALGVHMGERLLMKGRMNDAHYEDRDFLRLNETILRRLKGRWDNPPTIEAIESVRGRYAPYIQNLIKTKDKRKLWGWKDPRTCLTISLYAPYLINPRYIQVKRSDEAVCASLVKRSGHNVEFWRGLHIRYLTSLVRFFKEHERLTIWYEDLMDRDRAPSTIAAINEYVSGNGNVREAIKRIKFRG